MKTLLIVACSFIQLSVFGQVALPLIQNTFNATDTVGCEPLVVGFGFLDSNIVSLNWNFGDGNFSASPNPIHIYTNPGIYTVKLDVLYLNGLTKHFERKNYIRAIDKPHIDVQLQNYSACLNSQSINLINHSTNATSFIWNFGDGNLINDSNPSHIYQNPGNYPVNVFATNDYGCSSDSTIGFVEILPVQKNTIQVIGDTSSCDSSMVFQFKASPAGLASYQWLLSDSGSYSSETIYHSFNQYGVFDALLITKDNNGCMDTTYRKELVETYEITDDFQLSTQLACKNSSITFQSNAPNASAIHWDFGNGLTDTGKVVTVNFQDTGIYDVVMTVYRSNGCHTITEKRGILSVIDKPTTHFLVSDSNTCANSNVSFSIISTNANQFRWYYGNGSSTNQSNFSYQYKNPGNYTVRLIHKIGACSDTLTHPIRVTQPVAAFSNIDYYDCAPARVLFSNQSQKYQSSSWYFGNKDTSFLDSPTIDFNRPSVYEAKLVVTDTNGCKDSLIKQQAVTIKNNIPNDLEIGKFEGCAPLSVSFYNYSFGNGYWNWSFGDGTTSNQSNPSHVYNKQGKYIVSLTTLDSTGCAMIIDTFAIVTVNSLLLDSTTIELNCLDKEVTLRANCDDCLNGTWSLGDGITKDTFNLTHIYDESGRYNVNFEGLSILGCVGSKMFSINLDSCLIMPNEDEGGVGSSSSSANWIIDSIAPDSIPHNQFCNPITITIDNPVPNANAWIWHFGDGGTITGLTPTHTFDSIGLFGLKLIYEINNQWDTLYYHNFIHVTGHNSGIQVTSTESCFDMNLLLSSTNDQVANYFWSFDGQLLADHTFSIDTLLENSPSLHSITLTTVDSNNCSYSSSVGIISNGISHEFNFDSALCLGDTLFIDHNVTSDYQIIWNYGDSIIHNQPYYVFNETGNYNISAQVTNNNCIINYDLGSVSITSPNSLFTIDTFQKLCVGDTISAFALSTNNDSYKWITGNLKSLKTDSVFKGVITSTGLYSLTLETTLKNCSTSYSQTSIEEANEASADFTLNQDSYCLPIGVQLIDQSFAATKWEWNLGNGTIDSSKNVNYTFNQVPHSPISLTITDSNGCKATISKDNIELFKSTLSLSQFDGCAPTPISFSETSQNPVKWEWNFGDNSKDTIASPTHIYDTNGVFNVKLIVTSANGCKDTVTSTAITIDKVVAKFTSSINNGCAPQPAYFTNQSYNASKYSWNFGNGATNTGKDPIQIYYTGGNYQVNLIAESTTGCKDTTQSTIAVKGPAANFTLLDSVICENDSISFINQSTGASQYSWLFGDGYSSTKEFPSHRYDSSNVYKITLAVSDSFGCQNITSKNMNITINQLPKTDWSLSDSVGCTPLAVNYSSSIIAKKFLWMVNDSISSINCTNNQTLTTGDYNIKLIIESKEGCVDSSEIKKVTVHPVYDIELPELGRVCETKDTIHVQSSLNMGNWFIDGDSNQNHIFDLSNLTIGNHFIIQEMNTFCGDRDTTILTIDSLSKATLFAPDKVCEFDSIFQLTTSNNIGYWSGNGVIHPTDGLVDPSYLNYGINTAIYTIQNGGCTFLDTVAFEVIETPKSVFSINESILCENQFFELIPQTNKVNTNYHWNFTQPGLDSIISNDLNPLLKLSAGYWRISLITTFEGCSNESIVDSLFVYDTILPANPKIIRSTVLNDIEVLTEWETPSFGMEKVTGFDIWRSEDSVHFSLLEKVSADIRSYTDTKTEVDNQNYYYSIIPTNVCKLNPKQENLSSSILLTKEPIDDLQIKLDWTNYSKWEDGVKEYVLERLTEGGNWEEVVKVSGNETSVVIEHP